MLSQQCSEGSGPILGGSEPTWLRRAQRCVAETAVLKITWFVWQYSGDHVDLGD